jgi:AcrR family transcriptional regulator
MIPETSPRQEALLQELLTLFLKEGFRGFTLADLAERLRCSKTTLYAFGHSKEQVTVNVAVAFFRQAAAAVEAATDEQTDPSLRLAAYLTAVADALRPASTSFMADLVAHPATRVVYENNTQVAARRVRDLVAEGISAGSFRKVHGAFVAEAAAAMMRRIQSGEIRAATGLHDAEAYDQLSDLILNGIRHEVSEAHD